jgi:aminoglycoside 6'-N-acetyltransferase
MDELRDGDLRLRPMRDEPAEYVRLAAWRNRPHVREWWDPDEPPLSFEAAVREYSAGVRGETPDRLMVIEVAGEPVGFVQFYPWAPYREELARMELDLPEGAWSLDILIGEPRWLSRGAGSRAVRLLCDHMLAAEGATCVAFGVDRDNARARRAYLRAGMTAQGEYLDLDTRGGERVWCVLMMRTP